MKQASVSQSSPRGLDQAHRRSRWTCQKVTRPDYRETDASRRSRYVLALLDLAANVDLDATKRHEFLAEAFEINVRAKGRCSPMLNLIGSRPTGPVRWVWCVLQRNQTARL